MTRATLSRTLLLLVLAGCAGTPTPVPLEANRAELAAIAGKWEGTYDSPATGRSGSIQFAIREGADTAHGDVVMMPRHSGGAPTAAGGDMAGSTMQTVPRPLTIRFVRIAAGRVSGAIAPYTDPDCQCLVSTTFDGTLNGDRIEGTYRTTGSSLQTTGRWQVRRSAAP